MDKAKIVALIESGGSLRITIPKQFRAIFSGRDYASVTQQGNTIVVEPIDLKVGERD